VISTTREVIQVVAEQYIAQNAGQANPNGIGIKHESDAMTVRPAFPRRLTRRPTISSGDIGDRNAISVDRAQINIRDEVPQRNHGG
jgi:hypothetical protein